MNSLLRQPLKHQNNSDQAQLVHEVTPESANWNFVGFSLYDLQTGNNIELHDNTNESCIVIMSGVATITVDSQTFSSIGERSSVFDNTPPFAVYAPNGRTVHITAESNIEIAHCRSPGNNNYPTRLITPQQMSVEVRGSDTNTRHVHNILPETEPADSLLVVEVKTPSGCWSSYPPHKHDMNNMPVESLLEETYYHRLNPSQGFAFQRVYTDDLSIDETMTVHDRDMVLVPKGYHPYGVAHGYEGYYLNVMAGPVRAWKFNNHKDHEWLIT